MVVVKMVRDTGARWNTTEFTKYYMDTYKRLREDSEYVFPVRAWAMYGVHIKRFMKKYNLSNQEYKLFLDWVFSDDFLCGRKNIGFMCIVDPDVYQLFVRILKRNSPHVVQVMTSEEEKKIRERVHASKTLFPEDK